MLAVVFLAAYAVARGTIGMVARWRRAAGRRASISATSWRSRRRSPIACACGRRRGTTPRAAAIRSRRRCGRWRPAACSAPASASATRATFLPDTPIWCSRRSAKSSALPVCWSSALLYAAIVARALATARRASTDYGFFLAITIALFLAVPVLLMASGTLGLVPLTGVVTPFLSFGGSAMVANFAALGLLASIRSDDAPAADLTAFAVAAALAGGALAVAARRAGDRSRRASRSARADEFVAKPHLGVQADGMRRFQYNPRLLDSSGASHAAPSWIATAWRSRPTIAELAATRPRRHMRKLGIALDVRLPGSPTRAAIRSADARFTCSAMPTTRRNWSASNTSFVERDSESRLRGFDDHQTMVPVCETDGPRARPSAARLSRSRRRFSAIGTIPDHPAVKAAMDPHRELRLTDRCAAAGARRRDRCRRTRGAHRAAAPRRVVIDPATGDLLASVSYPWPLGRRCPTSRRTRGGRHGCAAGSGALRPVSAGIDVQADHRGGGAAPRRRRRGSDLHVQPAARRSRRRARAGLRASDSRRRDGSSSRMGRSTCIARWWCRATRTSRSSRSGSGRRRCSQRRSRRRSRSRATTPCPRIRDTLPQVGYGQGEVVASPLRMARIAAAIAVDGSIRDVRIDATARSPVAHPFLPPDTARTAWPLHARRRARRNRTQPAIESGCDRRKDRHRGSRPARRRIPGSSGSRRTATATPPRRGRRRFSRTPGYGGAGAAPAAGEIIAAAAALGLRVTSVRADDERSYPDMSEDWTSRVRHGSSNAESAGRLMRRSVEFVGRSATAPLEIVHAVLDRAEHEIQDIGRGRRVFPFNRVRVLVVAGRATRKPARGSPRSSTARRRCRSGSPSGCGRPAARSSDSRPKSCTPTARRRLGGRGFPRRVRPRRRAAGGCGRAAAAAPTQARVADQARGASRARPNSARYAFSGGRIDIGRRAEVVDQRQRLIRTNHVAFRTTGRTRTAACRAGTPTSSSARSERCYRIWDDRSAHGTSIVRGGRTIKVPAGRARHASSKQATKSRSATRGCG